MQVIFCYFHHWKSVADATSLCTRERWCGGVVFLVVRMASLSPSRVSSPAQLWGEQHHITSPLLCSREVSSATDFQWWNFSGSAWWETITCIINIIFAVEQSIYRVCILISFFFYFPPFSFILLWLFINCFEIQIAVFNPPPFCVLLPFLATSTTSWPIVH